MYPKVIEAINTASFIDLNDLLLARPSTKKIPLCMDANGQLVYSDAKKEWMLTLPEWMRAFARLIRLAQDMGRGDIADAWFEYRDNLCVQLQTHSWTTACWYDTLVRREAALSGSYVYRADNYTMWQQAKEGPVDAPRASPMAASGREPFKKPHNKPGHHEGHSKKPCHDFNAPGGCTRQSCHFAHTCMRCSKPHPISSCRVGSGEKPKST
jgi:hypothetical protein